MALHIFWLLLKTCAVVALPFVGLVRVGVWASSRGAPPWLAVLAAGASALALVTIVAAAASRRLTGRVRARWVFHRLALPLVLVYGAYGLFTLRSENARSPEVRARYGRLHPVFRLALGTAILMDRGIVVTDLSRTPADYGRMGLPPRETSLHFPQGDGYVYAADLRTRGRAGWKNVVAVLYFKTMGFRTLRHVGTADHLHVSLPGP
ncbi:MAG: hypothetical protein ACE5HF_07670 [Gemmatimonadota bacterium]